MNHRLRQALDNPARWILLATAGTVLCFSTLGLAGISPVLVFFSLVPMTLAPVFTAITTWRHGTALGALVAGASAAALLVLFQPPMAGLSLVQFAATGLVLGRGLRRRTPPIPLLFWTALIPSLLTIGAGAAYLLTGPSPPSEGWHQILEALRLGLEENAKQIPLDPEELLRFQTGMQALLDFFQTAFPALIFLNTFGLGFVNLLLCLHLSHGLGLDRSHLPLLREIVLPFGWVWGLIASGLVYLLEVPYLRWIGLNAGMILLLAYLMQGFGILSFYLNRTRLPAAARALIYLFCLMNLPLILVLCGVGLFDTWFDFRRRTPRRGS